MSSDLFQPFSDKRDALNIKPTERHLLVSIKKQRLILYDKDSAAWYQVSTSKNPPSCQDGSEGTPIGIHRIAEKIGDDSPLGTVFKAREPLEKRYWELPVEEQESNLITTRILWLEGLEDGVNKGDGIDSYDRYIYIHGTNQERAIGEPSSGGCITLKNSDMIELYNIVKEGDLVYIHPDHEED